MGAASARAGAGRNQARCQMITRALIIAVAVLFVFGAWQTIRANSFRAEVELLRAEIETRERAENEIDGCDDGVEHFLDCL